MDNQKRLIYADDLLEKAYEYGKWMPVRVVAVDDIQTVPTVDAVEVVHGRWEAAGFDGHGDYKECCSNCKTWSIGADKLYCPCCGAKMDGDGNV